MSPADAQALMAQFVFSRAELNSSHNNAFFSF